MLLLIMLSERTLMIMLGRCNVMSGPNMWTDCLTDIKIKGTTILAWLKTKHLSHAVGTLCCVKINIHHSKLTVMVSQTLCLPMQSTVLHVQMLRLHVTVG